MLFKKHLLTLVILPLFVLFVVASYFRFMVLQDYTVGYEGDCDPYTQSCYFYCDEWDDEDPNNDDECAEPFYYSWMERNAGMIYQTCGHGNVLECDAAYECGNEDGTCRIYFCDPETEPDDCEYLTEADMPPEHSFEPEIVSEGDFEVINDTETDDEVLLEETLVEEVTPTDV